MLSLWNTVSDTRKTYPTLDKELEIDVAIIGGGITGVTAANQLIKSGQTVALLEASKIGGVTTASSTGNLYLAVQPLYQSIEKKFNLDVAKTVLQSRQFALDYIEHTVKEKKLNCHFKKRPWYAYANECSNTLKKEAALFDKMNVAFGYTKNIPLNVAYKNAIEVPNQARFNPLHYVTELAQALQRQGCHIFENTRVLSVEENSRCVVTTKYGSVFAKKVFIATHTPIGLNSIQTFTAPYRSYVLAVTLKDKIYPEGHFWDFDNAPIALCTHPISKEHPELLMVSGRHHKTGQGVPMNTHFKELANFLKQRFAVNNIAYQWSAQHYQSADKLPYIGLAHRGAKNIYMATGYFADGLVYGTLAGLIIGDLFSNHINEFECIYKVINQDLFKSAGFWLRENGNVLLQYLKDIPLINNPDYKNLKRGEGIIVDINQGKCALSRDANDTLHAVSAVCPHMKCIVRWNDVEQTWDCPCHGSRFTPGGEVIEGPAVEGLAPINGQFEDNK